MTRYNELSLSKRAQAYLARSGNAENSDTPQRIAEQLAAAGLVPFPDVVQTFYCFGGFCLPMGIEGRFKVYRAKTAIRTMRLSGDPSDDPDRFRIPLGESETIQACFSMDGHGRLYEDDRPLSAGMVAWIEEWSAR